MKINLTEIIITIITIILVFSISFYQTSQVEPGNICSQDLNCIIKLIDNKENNSNYCQSAKEPTSCYSTIAFTINSKFCNNTTNSSKCFENNAVLKENISLCEFTNNYDNCIFQIASNSNKAIICEHSENIDRCYYSYALALKSKSLCDKANTLKELCLSKLE